PYFLTHEWAAPYRARRILELLQAKQKLTADDFRAIQGDTYSIAGAIFARETVKTLQSQAKEDEKLRAMLESLQGWSAHVGSESTVAPLVAEMRSAFYKRVIDAALGA